MLRLAPLLLAIAWTLYAQDPSADGMKALGEQRWADAEAAFAKVLEAAPKDYAAQFHLAFAQSMLNKDSEAIASYRKALELKPGLYEAELNLGILLLEKKEASEAAKLLEQAAKAKPKEFRPVLYAAEALTAAGRVPDALPYYKSAIELNPKSGDAELGLARSLLKSGALAEAANHFRRAGELDPKLAEAELELGMAYEAGGQKQEAISVYRKFPNNAGARERAGQLLLESGKPDDAIAQLEAAVAASPTAANRYALAMAYNLSKQFAKAEPLLQAVLQFDPSNVDIRMTYARVLREQKKYPAAAQEFYRVAQAKPDSAEAWSDLAGMLILMEQYQQALAALDKVRSLGAEKPAHHYFRAIILDRHKMYAPALESYEKFLELSDGNFPDEEFKARQRVRIIKRELSKR